MNRYYFAQKIERIGSAIRSLTWMLRSPTVDDMFDESEMFDDMMAEVKKHNNALKELLEEMRSYQEEWWKNGKQET